MENLWKTKLAAWLHDPAEKALILLRDNEGHEWGTAARLRKAVGITHDAALKKADWWASAADRPQFPTEGKRFAHWTQVDFAKAPILKHPLSGTEYPLGKLDEIDPEVLKNISESHFRDLIIKDEEGRTDFGKTLLNFWRFGPEIEAQGIGKLWQNLPADTRIPDHSIWAHLDITSAFAGAMTADKEGIPALLSISFGPVQGFIAEARTTSDLWAGSHLLARIAWEGMKVICKRLGPDAILFPNLRGIPLVDVWLREEVGLPSEKFENLGWTRLKSDANPLFMAALPNRFVALVPADQVQNLTAEIESRLREFIREQGQKALHKILAAIGEPKRKNLPCYEQLEAQLQGFPEVYWAAVPWSLAIKNDQPDANNIKGILSNFYPEEGKVGFLDSEAWKVLQTPIELNGVKFYRPNPGVLYPAVYDLLDRVAAAAKTARPFDQLKQQGYRSTLNGEREWLTLDRGQLDLPPGQREHTLWTRLAKEQPSWARKGEHLDGVNTIKRLWPTLFTEEVRDIVGQEVNRYVVSTHTLALAVSLERWLDNPTDIPPKLRNLLQSREAQRTALPRRLITKLENSRHPDAELLCRKLPALLDTLKESDNPQDQEMLQEAEKDIEKLFGCRPEAYYGMILMDGDRMGAWLAGTEPRYQQAYEKSWHPTIRASVEQRFSGEPLLQKYLREYRPPSPARHRVISEALNHFSIKVARFVVEDCFKGKLVYAGGDDVLAFVCVDDLLPAMTLLRALYSGSAIPPRVKDRMDEKNARRCQSKKGYIQLDDALLLTMGEKAEASAGAVVVHHQAPLGYVLKQLRAAESQAKNRGDRNAFSLRVFKRAGGEISVTDKWDRKDPFGKNAPELLGKLIALFSSEQVSRRAAYHSLRWLQQLPPQPDREMLQANLMYQFGQQGGDKDLARELAAYAFDHHPDNPTETLENLLMVGEFLARETRAGQNANPAKEQAA
ncbi:MAG: type III-B CRISPR-associated protein Cas10/Cmr2 [Methylothermaceae bacterium]|nr:type III-B CRISPR-associated protein Cas10/Cmr2 [Methylothermaceae bacterium]